LEAFQKAGFPDRKHRGLKASEKLLKILSKLTFFDREVFQKVVFSGPIFTVNFRKKEFRGCMFAGL
jgi:hypothetical protein